jgi:hypothetical protein
MSEDDKKHYVTSVYTGRYKSQGKIKIPKSLLTAKFQEKHNKIVKKTSNRPIISRLSFRLIF